MPISERSKGNTQGRRRRAQDGTLREELGNILANKIPGRKKGCEGTEIIVYHLGHSQETYKVTTR